MKRSFEEDLEELEMDAVYTLRRMGVERSPSPPSIKPERDAAKARIKAAEAELGPFVPKHMPRNIMNMLPDDVVSNPNIASILSLGDNRGDFVLSISFKK